MSKNNIIEKIQQLKGLIDSVTQSNSNTSEVWNLIKEIQTDFKQVTLERTEQQELWQNLQERVTELKYKQADIRNQNEEFVQQMLQKLEVVDYQISEILLNEKLSKSDIEEAKKPLLEVREVLKTPFYPSKEARQAVWDIYNGIYQRIKEREDQYYETVKNARNERFKHAGQLTENILDLINACQPQPTQEAMDKLTNAMQNLSELGYDIEAIKPMLEIKNNTTSLKIKSESFRDMKRFVRSHHDELTRENKDAIYDRFGVLQSDLDTAWEEYKISRSTKQDNWRKKQIDFVARLELRISDQKDYKLKLEQRAENQKEYLRKLYSRLNNQKEYVVKLKNDIVKQELFIERQEKHLTSLEDKYYMALSDTFKEKVNQWMDEAEDKIDSAEDSIVAKKDKIKEVENSFDDIKSKIEDVKVGIESIPKQMEDVDKGIVEIQATVKDVLSKLK